MPFPKQRLIQIVRHVAEKVIDQREERIRLAAVLFAGSRRLIAADRSSETGFAFMQEHWNLEEALQHLASLDLDLSNGQLFGKFLSGLLAIDQSFSPDQNSPPPLHPAITEESTRLDTLGDPEPVLRGTVHHWINIPSVLRRAHKIGRWRKGPREFLDPVTQNLEYMTLYLSDHEKPVLRSLRHSLMPLRSELERRGRLVEKGTFRLAFCPLFGPWHPIFEIPKDVTPPAFRAVKSDSMANAEGLESYLASLMLKASEEDIRLIAFPELTLDEPRRALIEQRLSNPKTSILAVIAGSFHTDDEPKPYNEAIMLDAAGFRHWRQRKNSRYAVPSGTELGKFFPESSDVVLERELPELISYGEELWFFDTSLGRLTILICTDAIDQHGEGYLPLILSLRPELILVLSMSDVTQDFRRFLEEMVRHGIGVAFVNAACVCAREEDTDLLLLDLAIRKLPTAPPVRWRWPASRTGPEWYDTRNKEWIALTEDEERSKVKGVWRLRQEGGEAYGVVVDVAALLRPLLEG